ncbi:helix-turn-helix domain-containing protein [Aeromicrobium alkaliterrae]|uniref:Winged helix-turn-helix transcriptional regulator n=1 Tax=Aeromicrobium alkaliterrae TaxID=302168 RepID=A0ABN2JXV9_9ACTN
MASRSYGQYCGVVTALEQVGERWALLIVRDLLVGPRRYVDLKNGLPRIPTNILSKRLKELQDDGVVRRVPLAHRGLVYELTDRGRALEPLMLALGEWGFGAMGEPGPEDIVTLDSMTMAFRTSFRRDVAAELPATRYEVHVGPVALNLAVDGGELRVRPVEGGPLVRVADGELAEEADADLVIVCGPGIRELVAGTVTASEAIAAELVSVQAGDPALLDRFARTFHLDPGRTPSGA